jgi:hypothetical protein
LARAPFEKAPPETAPEKRERIFKEGAEALAEHQAAAINVRKNMERLKALRLAKEAADQAAASTAAKPASKKAPTKSTSRGRKPRHF